MYLLDTNAVSGLRRRDRANPGLRAWIEQQEPTNLYLSVVSILEIEAGILRVARRDKTQGAVLRGWLEERVLPAYEGRILPVDVDVARRCAALHVPDPRPERDALIAATAAVHRLAVVTRNIADFPGMEVVNPWTTD